MKKDVLLIKLISSILYLIISIILFIVFILYKKNYNLIILYCGFIVLGSYFTYKYSKLLKDR